MTSTSAASSSFAPAPLPPRPPAWPVLGHLPQIQSAGMLPYLEQQWRKLGDVFSVNLGFEAVVVAHPEGIKYVLAGNPKNYVKGRTYDGVRRIIGNGLLALEGEAWKQRRVLLQPAFHRSSVAALTAAMVESGARFFDALQARHGTGAFRVDAHREMVALTMDVVVATLFGRELSAAAQVSYEALGTAMELVSERSNGLLLPRWVPTPGNRRFHRTMEEVESAVYRIIEAGRRQGPGTGTLLSMLLDSRDAETQAPLTDREVRDEVFTMLVAGHETTALTLTWLFTLLDGQPAVHEAMVAEVDRVLGGREPTAEDVPALVLLRQVVDETLRLRGPVAMNARDVVADDEILGKRVRAGQVVMPFFHGAHRHPDFWPHPDTFDPSRFTPEANRARHPWAYVPFSAGQRQCIGNVFSLVESVVLLAQLLQRFELKVDPGQSAVRPVAMATVRPDRPVMLTLRARRG